MPEGFMAHGALVWPVGCRGLKRRRRRGTDGRTATGRLTGGGLLGIGSRRGRGDVSRAGSVGLLTDGALHRVVAVAVRVVMLRQRRE